MNRESFRYAPSIIAGGLLLMAAWLLAQVLTHIMEILVVVFLGAVLGIVLEPVATFFTRFRVPRTLSVIAIYAFVAGLLALFAWYAIPEIVDEGDMLVERIETLEEDYTEFAEGSGLPEWQELRDYAEQVGNTVAPSIAAQALAWASVLLSLLTILVVAVFFTTVQQSSRSLVLSLIATRHRATWDGVLATMGRRLRRYAVGELISMTIVGVITYIGLTILGVPFAFVLAAIAFLTELLPIVGPWLGFVPALAIAATEGWKEVLLVSGLYLGIQQLESNVILPLVQRHQSELPAIIIFVAILAGGALMGILGALAALPFAIIVHTVLTEVVIPWRQRKAAGPDAGGPPPPTAGDVS